MQPNERIVKRIKENYPIGCRVTLDKMDDKQAPPEGTQGTVAVMDASEPSMSSGTTAGRWA